MKFSFLSIFLLTLILCSCAKDDTIPPNGLQITLGECKTISSNNLSVICFNSVISESRCPIGAECFWAGYVSVSLTLKTKTVTQNFSLSTISKDGFPPTDTLLSGYHIKLVDVKPYPNINVQPTEKTSVILQVTQ